MSDEDVTFKRWRAAVRDACAQEQLDDQMLENLHATVNWQHQRISIIQSTLHLIRVLHIPDPDNETHIIDKVCADHIGVIAWPTLHACPNCLTRLVERCAECKRVWPCDTLTLVREAG